jgi:putative nucleotidyltransferase with HDIG domain
LSAKQGQGATPLEQSGALRALPSVAVVAAGLFLVAFELVWKVQLIRPGSWGDRAVNLALFLVVGPAMVWWGRSMSWGLLRRLASAGAASEEKSRFLELRNRQLQTVLQASRAMTAVLDLGQVAARVIDQVTAHTRFTRSCLVLGPVEQDDCRLAAAHGLSASFLQEFMHGITGPLKSASPVEWCRVTRQPVVVECLSRDFRTAGMRSVFSLGGVEGMIATPLIYQNQFRGALLVFQEHGGSISTAEISLVSALACQAAVALENARLYSLSDYHRVRMDSALDLFRNVAAALARPRSGVSSMLHMVAQVAARLCAPARIHLVVTKSGRQAPISVIEAVGLEAEPAATPALSLPVALDDDHFGQMDVYVPEGRRSIGAEEVQILQSFMNLAASSLANATIVADMRQTVEVVEGAYMGTLEALTKALEMRDHETEGHSRRVVQYTLSLAQQIGVPEEQLVTIMRGALLHDIGKIGIPDAILKKQGPLTAEEWMVMRQHPSIGYEMLKGIEFLREATPIILHHHERFDGSGYPEGLRGEAIPLGARIFAIADAYDAITSDRPYRKGRSHEVAMAEIAAVAGSQFDPQVVEALQALPPEELSRIRGRDLDSIRHHVE